MKGSDGDMKGSGEWVIASAADPKEETRATDTKWGLPDPRMSV